MIICVKYLWRCFQWRSGLKTLCPLPLWIQQHPIVCPLKFRIKGCFSLSYRPQISLKHVSSWYHRTCRVSPVFHRTQWRIQWDKGFPPLCLPILRDKCQIKVMKETYFPEINEMYQRIAARLQQLDSHPQQPKSEQLEKLEVFKAMLEHLITFLQVSKSRL